VGEETKRERLVLLIARVNSDLPNEELVSKITQYGLGPEDVITEMVEVRVLE